MLKHVSKCLLIIPNYPPQANFLFSEEFRVRRLIKYTMSLEIPVIEDEDVLLLSWSWQMSLSWDVFENM